MTDTNTREYKFTLPEDTADLFERFCREQPNSPTNNIASRVIRDGIEATLMLHPQWQEQMDYEPHEQSVAARLSRPAPVTVSREALRKLVDESADAGMDRLETMEHILSALTPSPQLTEQEKQADLEVETARMSPEALDGPQDVAQAARVLLGAMPLLGKPLAEMHKNIDWCRSHQNTYDISHPSQLDGGTTCAEDLQDAWEAALRALAEQEQG